MKEKYLQRRIMKSGEFLILGIILCLLLGCAKISPTDASKMSKEELCDVLMGVAIPPKDRRTVNAEVVDRGISCRDESTQTDFDQQKGMYNRGPTNY
jgi:hypothetical protein